MASFDIALAAVGVRVTDGEVSDVLVHPGALLSVLRREPLLLLPMPNQPFLLATAERVLRYARELGWPCPEVQLLQLQEVMWAMCFTKCPLGSPVCCGWLFVVARCISLSGVQEFPSP